jgi:hypothetical protein
MKPQKVFRMSALAVGGIMVALLAINLNGSPVGWMKTALLESFSVTPAVAQAGSLENRELGTASFQVAKRVRPAAKKESPEEAQLKQLPKPVPPGQLRRPSKAELLDKCTKSPKCKAKLQAAKKRGPNKPRPAAREESPEDKELKKLPKPTNPKARGQQPRSDLMLPAKAQTLLSWLNPFQVDSVYAQSAVSINLTPGGPYTSGSYMTLYAARVYYNNRFYFSSRDSFPNYPNSENKPFAFLRFSVPATGTYLVNVQAGRGKAKMRHQSNGPIIDTWDFTAQPSGTYDYLTAEYLEQGVQYFYFWPDGSSFYIYSASLESYP